MKLAALLVGLLLLAVGEPTNGRRLGRSPKPRQAVPAKFSVAVPGYPWQFPRDAFAHPNFATEWWYFTGNLRTSDHRRFGFELTFFRIAPAPATPLDRQLYFTHFSITNAAAGSFAFHTRAHRGNWAQAGITHTPTGFKLWDENWTAAFNSRGPANLHARWGPLSLDLVLTPGRRMLNGFHGWSQKGTAPGEASYYYSFPHIRAQGTVNGAPASGLVWMDHEFATDQLAPDQLGWDWMGLHLPQGDLMLFDLRLAGHRRDPHSAGTWRPRGAAAVALHAADFQMTPLQYWKSYPISWRVQIPRFGLDFRLVPEVNDQLIRAPAMGVSYWEGAVTTSNGGEGYLELTGYGGGRLH